MKKKFVIVTLFVIAMMIAFWERTKHVIESEESVFLNEADSLSPIDRSALLNRFARTGELPRLMPWWEQDKDVCAAFSVQLIHLFGNVRLQEDDAWKIRAKNTNLLDTIIDFSGLYIADENASALAKSAAVAATKVYPFDTHEIYLVGFLWEKTKWKQQIESAHKDLNSHVVLVLNGRVVHFMHHNHDDPVRVETWNAFFADGDMKPMWITKVNNVVLPSTEHELVAKQHIMPWHELEPRLSFTTEPKNRPAFLLPAYRLIDSFWEKSSLTWWHEEYDMYPTKFQMVK